MRSPLLSRAVVDAWFDTLRPEQRATAQALRQAVLTAAPGLSQAVKWGNLVFLHHGRHALAIVVHRELAHLQVFAGAALAARYSMLEGGGRDVRHLKVSYATPFDAELMRRLVQDAVAAVG